MSATYDTLVARGKRIQDITPVDVRTTSHFVLSCARVARYRRLQHNSGTMILDIAATFVKVEII